MGPFVSGFRTSLSEGYSVLVVGNMLTNIGALGRWMQEHDDCVALGLRRVPSVKSYEPLLRFLRRERVIGEPPASTSELERLLVDYRGWLVAERGLAEATISRYENLACRFMQQHLTAGRIESGSLSGAQVVSFLLRESERVSVGSAKGRVAELRSLLTTSRSGHPSAPAWSVRRSPPTSTRQRVARG